MNINSSNLICKQGATQCEIDPDGVERQGDGNVQAGFKKAEGHRIKSLSVFDNVEGT